ncbi:MAG: phosphodiester glycosidase family protein [Spirulina sp.]
MAIAVLGLVACSPPADTDATTASEVLPSPSPTYETLSLPSATVHWVTIPDPVRYPVRVAVTESLTPVEAMADQVCGTEGCAAAINAGFFDPNNGLTTSAVVMDGKLVADPRQNERLVGNPDLASYLDNILNRSEFRRYTCDGMPSYAITFHQDPIPAGCALAESVGAGPQILPESTAIEEGFLDPATGRDAIGSQSANARSAVGLTAHGAVVLAMVAQVPGVSPSGLSLPDLAALMAERGVVQALNLDGGSSSTLMAEGTTHYGRLNQTGEWVQRPVKSILWVSSQPTIDP